MRLKPRIFRKPQLTHPLARGLVAYWLHNEGSGLITNDVSGNGNYGTITGATWQGDALTFDGDNDFIDMGINISLGTGPFTLLGWYNGNQDENFIGFMGAIDGGNGYSLQLHRGDVRHWVNGVFTTGSISVRGDIWHQVAITRNGTTGRIFVDGSQDGSDFVTDAGNVDTGQNTLIGDWGGGAAFRVSGLIRDVLIYRRELLSFEIQQLKRDPYILFRQDPAWMGQVAVVVGANPKGPLTHPLYGPFAGPIAC